MALNMVQLSTGPEYNSQTVTITDCDVLYKIVYSDLCKQNKAE